MQDEQTAAEFVWTTSVGQLIAALSVFDPEAEVTFGETSDGRPLEFHKVKRRGPKLVQIEIRDLP